MKKLPKLRMPHITFNFKKLAIYGSIIGVLLATGSGYFTYTRLYMKPVRRFWAAIDNSMTTSSVVKETRTGGTGNKTIEKIRFTYGAQASARKVTDASIKSATVESNVTTEVIDTPTDEFVRYKNITTNEKKGSGEAYNFGLIKDVWAKQPASTQDDGLKNKQTFVQSHVTLAPFGNASQAARKEMLSALREGGAYKIDLDNINSKEVDGEMYFEYNISVQTKKYVTALQKYFIAIGYGEFGPLNGDNYTDTAHINAQFLVRKRDNVISGIIFNNLTENYTNYGITAKTDLPTVYIGLNELQDRLQTAQ